MKNRFYKNVFCITFCASALLACKERLPLSNTEPYYRLHGIVNDGKTINEITLLNMGGERQPKLRFPPDIRVSVETFDTHNPNPKVIRKGFADSAAVGLELNAEKHLIPIVNSVDHPVYDIVQIRFHARMPGSDPQLVEKELSAIIRESVRTTDKVEWGLREYVLYIPKSERVSDYKYVPFDQSFRSPDGSRMWIGCNSAGGSLSTDNRLSSCASHFSAASGLAVTYNFDAKLLPYWREIYREVLKFTDSVSVPN